MDMAAALETLLQGNQLKRTPRTGWIQRGVEGAESVADHSYGVCFVALVLAEVIDPNLDRGRLLSMAVLHDLPEALTSDIPTPAWRRMPAGSKSQVERSAMEDILSGLPFAPGWMTLWEELKAAETAESLVVHDADRLDLFLQALKYEEQTGNRQLQEFWQIETQFHYPQSQAFYDELRRRRSQASSADPPG